MTDHVTAGKFHYTLVRGWEWKTEIMSWHLLKTNKQKQFSPHRSIEIPMGFQELYVWLIWFKKILRDWLEHRKCVLFNITLLFKLP